MLAIETTRLLADGANPLFLQLLTDKRSWQVSLFCDDRINGLRKPLKQLQVTWNVDQQFITKGFAHPEPRLGPQLVDFILRIAPCSKKLRRAHLQLLELRQIGEMFDKWQDWWLEVNEVERQIRRLLGRNRQHLRPEDKPALKQLKSQLVQLEEQTPPPFHLAEYVELVDNISAASGEAVLQALVAGAQNLRGEPVQKFLSSWFSVLRHTSKKPALLIRLITAQGQLLKQKWPNQQAEKQSWLADAAFYR